MDFIIIFLTRTESNLKMSLDLPSPSLYEYASKKKNYLEKYQLNLRSIGGE